MEALGVTDWELLGKGVTSRAYHSLSLPDVVIVFSDDPVKSLLSGLDLSNHPHLPKISWDEEGQFYIMPKYQVEGTIESSPDYQILNALDMYTYARYKGFEQVYAFITDYFFLQLPKSVQDDFIFLAALVEEYAIENGYKMVTDIKGENLAQDKDGVLILLDVLYIYEY